jgi:hypothetical protein
VIDLYFNLSRFVFSVIPPGGEELKGDEVDRIVTFKNSLGLDDPDAAGVHMEVIFVVFAYNANLRVFILRRESSLCLSLTGLFLVDHHSQIGRKLFRQRLEVGDREADVEQRRVCLLYLLPTCIIEPNMAITFGLYKNGKYLELDH